jgi:hypothetical protein
MQVDPCYVGKQNHSRYIIWRKLGAFPRGVFSPLLRSLVVDDLLWGLNDVGWYRIGYVGDITILINGIFLSTISERLKQFRTWFKDRVKEHVFPSILIRR